jgi:hypothetical protein
MSDIAEFTVLWSKRAWIVRQDGQEIAGFASRKVAETVVLRLVEEQCKQGKASRITMEGEGPERRLVSWHCCAVPPPGTPRH